MPSEALKDSVRGLLASGDLEGVVAMARERRRVLGSLVALTFDADPLVVWRAIEAMGMSVEVLSRTNPLQVKEHMRRLYWLITEESGGVFWRAPECLAECSGRVPDFLADFVPIAFHLLETLEEEDLDHFRPGAIWAVGRLADVARQDLPALLPLVVKALEDPDPQARGMAVWSLAAIGENGTLAGRPELRDDPGPVSLYRNRFVEESTVGALTREVLGG